jgi:toxin CcdB
VGQFSVYRNESPRTNETYPLLVEVQAELLQDLKTRAVIPLAKSDELTDFPLMYLTPSVTFAGESYVLMTPLLAGVAVSELGSHVGSVADQERLIMTALHFLFEGF